MDDVEIEGVVDAGSPVERTRAQICRGDPGQVWRHLREIDPHLIGDVQTWLGYQQLPIPRQQLQCPAKRAKEHYLAVDVPHHKTWTRNLASELWTGVVWTLLRVEEEEDDDGDDGDGDDDESRLLQEKAKPLPIQ